MIRSNGCARAVFRPSTTAEGIESPDQVESLRRLGCEVGQGYHFARPLDADQVNDYLAGHRQPSGESLTTTR